MEVRGASKDQNEKYIIKNNLIHNIIYKEIDGVTYRMTACGVELQPNEIGMNELYCDEYFCPQCSSILLTIVRDK